MKLQFRRRLFATSVTVAIGCVVAAQAVPARADDVDQDHGNALTPNEHIVYTETNDTQNAVLAFRREEAGR